MYSVNARSKWVERGRNLSSFPLFFVDSLAEAVQAARRNRGLSLAITAFSGGVHAVLLALGWLIYGSGDPGAYGRYCGWTAVSFAAFTPWLMLQVRLLHDSTGRMRRSVGAANYLTLIRFFLIVPVIVLFSHGHLIAAIALYVVSGLTDIADGIVARSRGEQTEFGVVLDPLADVFTTAAVFGLFLREGLVPLWLFLILMVRYAMLIVGSFVMFLVLGPFEFRATIPGKIVGVLQATGIIIIGGCVWSGIPWENRIAPILYPVLGITFASIVVSQAVIGYRHRRRVAETK